MQNATENVTGCNKFKFKCPNIYDVPLISSITGSVNRMKNTSCTAVKQSSVDESGASTCENVQVKLKIFDSSQSITDSKCNSDASTSAVSDRDESTARSGNQDANSGMSGSGNSGGGTSSSDETKKLPNTGGSSGQNEIVTPTPTPILPVVTPAPADTQSPAVTPTPAVTPDPVVTPAPEVTPAPAVTEKPAAPVADFTADKKAGNPPLTVQFSDQSKNAVSYEWAFGDGNTSNDKSPSYTYIAEGDYIVTLTVTGSNGDKDTSKAKITVISDLQSSNTVINDLNETAVTGNATPLNS